jgi:serine/threonine protein kinase
MGRVWLARDEVLHRDVAVKEVVPPSGLTESEGEQASARGLREARAIARLNHPNVVRIFDVVARPRRPWIVMEYVKSRSLQDRIATDGPIPVAEVARIGLGIISAIQAAHRAGVLHRDVKPSNVLLAEDGRVVLTDFGLATLAGDATLTRSGLILGSPAYIAPERARQGITGPESDLWSLGATLYAAVEGRAPYHRSTAMATLTALVTEAPDPSLLAGPLAPVLHALLDKDPATRMAAPQAARLLRRLVGPPRQPDHQPWRTQRERRPALPPVPPVPALPPVPPVPALPPVPPVQVLPPARPVRAVAAAPPVPPAAPARPPSTPDRPRSVPAGARNVPVGSRTTPDGPPVAPTARLVTPRTPDTADEPPRAPETPADTGAAGTDATGVEVAGIDATGVEVAGTDATGAEPGEVGQAGGASTVEQPPVVPPTGETGDSAGPAGGVEPPLTPARGPEAPGAEQADRESTDRESTDRESTESEFAEQEVADPVSPNSETADPVSADPVSADPVSADPVSADPESMAPESVAAESVAAQRSGSESTVPELVALERTDSEQTGSDQTGSEQTGLAQTGSEQVAAEQVAAEPAGAEPAGPDRDDRAVVARASTQMPPAARPPVKRSASPPAVQPPPAGQAGTRPAAPGRKPLLLAVGGLVVIVIVAVVVLVALHHGSPGTASVTAAKTRSASPSAPTSASASPEASATGSPAPSAPQSAPASPPPTGATGAGDGALPAGWHMYHDPTGFSVAVPDGWTLTHSGSIVYFHDASGGRLLGIDQTNQPKSDPVADWTSQSQYRVSRGDFPGYQQIKIAAVPYHLKAADWEFTYNKSGTRIHVINRGAVFGPHQAYGFYWSTPDAVWSANISNFDLITSTFQGRTG